MKGTVVKLVVHDNQREDMSGEELREFDDIISSIWEMIENEEHGVSVVNDKRVREFILCESILRRVLTGRGIRIEVVPHDGFASVGVIRVSARNLTVKDPIAFSRAVNLASNYEIYPKTDGKIMFALTFYGMTKKIKE